MLAVAWILGPFVRVAAQHPAPDEFVAVDKQPAPLNLPDVKRSIVYPAAALDSAVAGKVFVKILVDESGRPVEHRIIKSPHRLLSEAVESRVYDLRFSPAERDGKPIAAWVTLPFQFAIEEKKKLALDDRLPQVVNLAQTLASVKPPKGLPPPNELEIEVYVSQTGTPVEIRYPSGLAPEWKAALDKHLYELKFEPAVVFDQPR
ncbi:MAG: energy transducer TonB, partial [Bacteroidia bacterium]|nr:energy transducer TonB [Bacteroidia bacterium]